VAKADAEKQALSKLDRIRDDLVKRSGALEVGLGGCCVATHGGGC